jgi:hypothetical protein
MQEFAPRFMDGYARANRQKPSGIAAKETILAVHLIPQLGTKRLDAITSEDVQHLKNHLRKKAPRNRESGRTPCEWGATESCTDACVQRSDWKGHVTIPKGGR